MSRNERSPRQSPPWPGELPPGRGTPSGLLVSGRSTEFGYSRTYSYSKGRPLIPALGLPSQFAILPGSVTGCMSERT